jgi:hypothetical protein
VPTGNESINPSTQDVGLVFLDSPITLDAYPGLTDLRVSTGRLAPTPTLVVNVGRIQDGVLSTTDLFVGPPAAAYDNRPLYTPPDGFPEAYDYWIDATTLQPGDSGGPALLSGTHTIVAVSSAVGPLWEWVARVDTAKGWIASQIFTRQAGMFPCPDVEVWCGLGGANQVAIFSCVDPSSNKYMCGATFGCGLAGGSPGVVCDPGDDCVDGGCTPQCPDGLVKCGGQCIDPMTDTTYCGAPPGCGVDGSLPGINCTTMGPASVCQAGMCACPTGALQCPQFRSGGVPYCIDPAVEPGFCGATGTCSVSDGTAGTNCAGGTCSEGTCTCPPNQIVCPSFGCVDPSSNNYACGATPGCGAGGGSAGVFCSGYTTCVQGQCL